MKWKKKGNIFNPEIDLNSEYSFAVVPFVGEIKDNLVTIYYNVRNKQNQSCLAWSIFDFEDDFKIVKSFTKLDLIPGVIGTFDEDGAMGCQLIEINNKKHLYYQGWNLAKSVPFRNAIGVALFDNETKVFSKYSNGPILDRSIYDTCFVATPNVFELQKGFYLMYYLSCDSWEKTDNRLIHKYNIKIAESTDGFDWIRTGKIAIDYESKYEYAFSVPRVIYEDGVYKMWYSYRGSENHNNYRIGYAESENAYSWQRKDAMVGINVSNEGWDSQMICYPYIFDYNKKKYMLYNGNNYGKTGFGIALLE